MIKNIEVEYKILVTKHQFDTLSSLYPDKTFIKQVNTYYDTANLRLHALHSALRIREKEGRFLMTLKTPADKGLNEYECYVNENSPAMFKEAGICDLLNSLNISDDLVIIGSCTTYRAVSQTKMAELCFDINDYGTATDYEIEYEQKIDHDGITEFNKVLSQIDLTFEKNCASKLQRMLAAK